MRKILFISPSWSEKLGTFGKLARFTSNAPPMGICYLGAVAARAGWDVELIDNEMERLPGAEIEERLRRFAPDVVGISAMTPSFFQAVEIAEFVKKELPRTRIVIGGPHISAVRAEGFEECFDIAVCGEGELTLGALLERWNGGGNGYGGIPGILYRDGGGVVDAGVAEWIQDLDSLPFPRRDLLKKGRYALHLREQGRVTATSMVSSRGCAFRCAYCSEPVAMGKRTRYRSVESILDEMEGCADGQGVSHFCFLTSTLTLDRGRMLDLSEGILRRGLRATWSGWTRADCVDREMIRRMKEAGFARVTLALESASEELLRNVGRKMNLEKVTEGFRICAGEGLEVWCLAMIGLPGETEETVRGTVEFIRGLPGVLTSSLSIAIPYPGTRLHEMARNGELGLELLTDDYSKYQRYGGGVMKVGGLTPAMLVRLQKRGLLRIHLTPRRILYFIRNMGFSNMLLSMLSMLSSFFTSESKDYHGNTETRKD